jgi:type II secretory pathway component PulM
VIPCRNFWDVAHGDEFLGLSSTKLVEFISSDELQVEREETVFQAVIRWLNHNPEQRRAEFHKVYILKIKLNVLNCISENKKPRHCFSSIIYKVTVKVKLSL